MGLPRYSAPLHVDALNYAADYIDTAFMPQAPNGSVSCDMCADYG